VLRGLRKEFEEAVNMIIEDIHWLEQVTLKNHRRKD
jgi:hypothetical protein